MLTNSQCRNIIHLELGIEVADDTEQVTTYWDLSDKERQQVDLYANQFLHGKDWETWFFATSK